MKPLKLFVLAALPLLLAGCLDVDQYPGWLAGEYAGKPDMRPYQARFHNDRFSWNAAIVNRSANQNEYNRAYP